MKTRIYKVQNVETAVVSLVEASSKAQALAALTRKQYEVKPATAADVAKAMTNGVQVIVAGEEPQE
jgi:hypothetical protein